MDGIFRPLYESLEMAFHWVNVRIGGNQRGTRRFGHSLEMPAMLFVIGMGSPR